MRGDLTPTELALARLAEQRASTSAARRVVVTILGDGKDTIGYDKREEIKRHLDDMDGVLEVSMPEMLYDLHGEADVEDVELAAIGSAHLIICLEPPDKHPLGMYTEIERYFRIREANKWFWVYPESRPNPRDDGSMVAAIAHNLIECMEPFEYRESEWERCERIRAGCEGRVKRAIAQERERALAVERKMG